MCSVQYFERHSGKVALICYKFVLWLSENKPFVYFIVKEVIYQWIFFMMYQQFFFFQLIKLSIHWIPSDRGKQMIKHSLHVCRWLKMILYLHPTCLLWNIWKDSSNALDKNIPSFTFIYFIQYFSTYIGNLHSRNWNEGGYSHISKKDSGG